MQPRAPFHSTITTSLVLQMVRERRAEVELLTVVVQTITTTPTVVVVAAAAAAAVVVVVVVVVVLTVRIMHHRQGIVEGTVEIRRRDLRSRSL
jgi:hypothetical protein